MSNINDYNYEYKEQHTKHITRPALVAIRKPLLQTTEMEDILTRLLRLYVPAVADKGVYSLGKGGIGRRAVLVRYDIANAYDVVNYGVPTNYTRSLIEQINNKKNLYLRYLADDAAAAKDELLNSRVFKDPDSYRSIENIDTFCNIGVIGRCRARKDKINVPKLVCDSLFTWNPDIFVKDWKKDIPVSYPLYDKYDLFLLSRADHEYLLPNKKSGVTTNLELQKRENWFAPGGLPVYKKTVVIFDPNDLQGKKHFFNRTDIKKALGYVPNQPVSAYHWVFYTTFNTEVIVTSEKVRVDNEGINKKNAITFEDLVRKLQVISAGLEDQISKWVPISEHKKNEARVLLNFINVGVKNNDNTKVKAYYLDYIYKNSTILNFSYEKPIPGAFGKTQTVNITAGDVIKKTIDDSLPYLSPQYFPMLDNTNGHITTEQKTDAIAEQFIKPEKECGADLTFGYFLVHYYSALLQRIKAKRNKLSYFMGDEEKGSVGLVRLAYEDDYINLIKQIEDNTKDRKELARDLIFISRCERFLFSPLSGFYITSYSTDTTDVKSPYLWNSQASIDSFVSNVLGVNLPRATKYATEINDQILDNQNKDVESIHIERVVSGSSYARITLKNANQKYSYPSEDPLNRTQLLIEPMDEVLIYLPTLSMDKSAAGIDRQSTSNLELVFSGIISNVKYNNQAGYNQISIMADCMKKRLSMTRTNTKPSLTREENSNKVITVFNMPNEFFKETSAWMPYMFAQATSMIFCQPKQTLSKEELEQKLYKTTPDPIKRFTTVTTVIPARVVATETITKELITTTEYEKAGYQHLSSPQYGVPISVEEAATLQLGPKTQVSVPIYKKVNVQHEKETVTKTVDTRAAESKTAKRTAVVGYRKKVEFADPLFTYLWYQTNSLQNPEEEQNDISTNLKYLLDDYIVSEISDGTETVNTERGVVSYITELRNGHRVSYIVYRNRYSGLLTEYTVVGDYKYIKAKMGSPIVEDRIQTATIVGTSQPSWVLTQKDTSIQFSAYQRNIDIINQVATRFNFICYTDRKGIIRFTPYQFDLTALNTNENYRLDTDLMYVEHTKNDLEKHDNPLILREQYMLSYRKTDNDSKIINWLNLTGNWVINAGVDEWTRAVVKDPVLIKKYGYRAASDISIIGIQDANALMLYGLAYMDRKNKQFSSADATCIYDSRMDVNTSYYIPSDEVIYYCSSISIDYAAGETCTCTLGLDYGKRPLFKLNAIRSIQKYQNIDGLLVFDATNAIDSLNTCFSINNDIRPTTYIQYLKLFEQLKNSYVSVASSVSNELTPLLTQSTLKVPDSKLLINSKDNYAESMYEQYVALTSVCCFNGYVWDNVAGISFEELVYNYAWINGGLNLGYIAAMGDKKSDKNLMQSLANIIKVDGTDINFPKKARQALSTFLIHVPAIENKTDYSIFDITSFVYDDLKVTGFPVGS